jgi:VPDSG-CTERM motif
MKKYQSPVLLRGLLLIALGSCSVGATPLPLEQIGNTTYDPNTGLEWLDLNLTAGQSYNSVLNGWNGYTTTQGFQFASRNEIIQLFTDAGATSIGFPSGPVNTANLQAATLTLSLLGTTLAQSSEDRSWMFYDPSTEPTLPSSSYVPAAVFGVGVIRAGYPPEGFFEVPGIFPTTGYSSPEMASALVRVVPDQGSTAMLLSASLGVILIARKLVNNEDWSDSAA